MKLKVYNFYKINFYFFLDAQNQLNNLRNSEIECKSQNEILLSQLRGCKIYFDFGILFGFLFIIYF
jgi:hypothetical protein